VSGSRKTASGDNKNTHAQRRIEKNLLQCRREITETPCGYEIRYLRRASARHARLRKQKVNQNGANCTGASKLEQESAERRILSLAQEPLTF
jgi:hypothetical protein